MQLIKLRYNPGVACTNPTPTTSTAAATADYDVVVHMEAGETLLVAQPLPVPASECTLTTQVKRKGKMGISVL